MAVNVLGCVAIGYLAVRFDGSTLPRHVRMGVLVGLLGGFTTFSTFGYETLLYIQHAKHTLALVNIAANVGLGLFCAWAGVYVGRQLTS